MIQVIGTTLALGILIPSVGMVLVRFLSLGSHLQQRLLILQEQVYCDRILREDLPLAGVRYRVRNAQVQRVQTSPQQFRNVTHSLHVTQTLDITAGGQRTLEIVGETKTWQFVEVVQ